MKKLLLLFAVSILLIAESSAQFTRYIVQLKNKGSNPFSLSNPSAYLSQRAIDRRTRYNITIDSTDLPVTPSYITQVKNVPNVTVLNISKWLNTIIIQTSDPSAITTISGFSFVQNVNGIAARVANNRSFDEDKFKDSITNAPVISRGEGITGDYYNYGASSFAEIHLHNGEFLHDIGLRGQGIQLALLDAGFNNYATLHAFDSINANGQILGTWDFVSGNTDVNDHDHGMECLSTIAANIPGQFIGKAPKASFYLFRTEDAATEFPIEEYNWACGAERADSAGVDVISTSLGYTQFDNASLNHTYADMNGNTTIAAIAADLAAKKGILVFAANGNDGNDAWHYLSTPADADSILAVGAVTSAGVVGSFSSYGPSSDGRIKPDVASVGVSAMIEYPGGTIGFGSGTSFACPNMAGLGSCLWQGFPEFNNMKIVSAMRQAGSISNAPDNRIGYGIPNMKLAFTNLLIDFANSNVTESNCVATLNWTSKDISAMKYEIERKTINDASFIKVGDVSPQAGTTLANHTYQFINQLTNIPSGTVSYRIKQIVDTALSTLTSVYIDTASVSFTSTCSVIIRLVPNPASSQSTSTLIVETPYAISNMPVTIYDMKGSLVAKLFETKGIGKANIDLPVSRFAKGKYIIKVYDDQKIIGSAELLIL